MSILKANNKDTLTFYTSEKESKHGLAWHLPPGSISSFQREKKRYEILEQLERDSVKAYSLGSRYPKHSTGNSLPGQGFPE